MTLLELMALIGTDETVHIIDDVSEKTLFFGKLGSAYSELDETVIKSKKVNRIYSGFGGMCIDTVDCK